MGTTPTQPWETDQRDAFRGRFGEGPDAYDRPRPVAPDSLFEDIVQLAGLEPGSMVVEIGPGTGQATRRLAEGGLRILALAIDPRLADRARHNLGAFPDVSVRTTSFEAWHPGEAMFDVVFACNSFHYSRLYGPHSSRNLGASLDELIVNTIHDPRGVVSTSRLHACASGVVGGGSHSDR